MSYEHGEVVDTIVDLYIKLAFVIINDDNGETLRNLINFFKCLFRRGKEEATRKDQHPIKRQHPKTQMHK